MVIEIASEQAGNVGVTDALIRVAKPYLATEGRKEESNEENQGKK